MERTTVITVVTMETQFQAMGKTSLIILIILYSCSNTCTVELGYSCLGGSSTGPDKCTLVVVNSDLLGVCQATASLFGNTCTSPTAGALSAVPTQSKSCAAVGVCATTV